MIKTDDFLRLTQNEVSQQLKVANPVFLKTGALGLLVNLLTIIKTDSANFTNSLVKEASPVTAETYESLFFHSTIKQQDISFSTPATFTVSFIIADTVLASGEVLKYSIDKGTVFKDSNGYGYTLEDNVEIYLSNGTIQGKKYKKDSIEELDVYKVPHPNNPTEYIYMVNTEIKQYERIFKLITVPSYLEESHKFSIQMNSISNIYQINAWRQIPSGQNQKVLNLSDYRSTKTDNLAMIYELEPLDIKYTKNLSNQLDDHIFVKFLENSLSFETGDGIYGRKPQANEKILIEIKLTEGKYGNIPSTEFTLNNIVVQQINADNTLDQKITSIKAVSIQGGSGGKQLESKEDIRRKLVQYRGEYIGSMSDIRNEFYIDNGEPYIDKKYFNSKHNIFIYNVIKDQMGKVIPTTTKNMKLKDLEKNLFLPEFTYDGIEMISPFYYVNFKNRVNAYLILPEIKVNLIPESGSQTNIVIQNNPSLFITYDWFERKTYLELRNTNINYKYIVTSNINTFTFSAGNSFRVEINKTFLNEYCLLDGFEKDAYNPDSNEVLKVPGYLNNLTLTIYDNEIKVLKYIQADSKKYTQTVLKQEHYYWIDVDIFDSSKETKYILNLPFIQKKYITNDIIAAAIKLDSFFKVQANESRINPNLSLHQAFYNTIKIEDIYRNYIFENSEVYTEPTISINIDVDINSINMQRSRWATTNDIEIDTQWLIQDYTKSIEGFSMEFNESKLEQKILNYFNSNYGVIRNVKIWNPSGPIRVRAAVEIQNMFDEHFGSKHIHLNPEELRNLVLDGEIPQVTQKQIIDFVPPYFTFNSKASIQFKLDN